MSLVADGPLIQVSGGPLALPGGPRDQA
jgi:hypothetical protein